MSNKPKANHPWRNYANKIKDKQPAQDTRLSRKPLQVFLTELVESWGRTDIATKYRGKFDRYYLLELPDHIVASWLNHLLRNCYSQYPNQREETDEEEVIDELES